MKTLMILTAVLLIVAIANARDFRQENCISSTTGKSFRCPAYVNECAETALAKLGSIAESQNGVLEPATLQVSMVDDRFYNPSKYVWFTAKAITDAGDEIEVSTLTQKSFLPLKECF